MSFAVFRTFGDCALNEADGVGYDGEYDRQVFSDTLRAAWKINDEGLSVNSGNCP